MATPDPRAAAEAQSSGGGRSWVLMPLAWCLWLLLWLLPSLVLGPRVSIVPGWMEGGAAPAALAAGATIFLLVIWPFWPALIGPCPIDRPLCPFARPALEIVMLIALAAPFALVAWSVGGRQFHVDGLTRAILAVGILALGTRILHVTVDSAGRWLMLAAMTACVAPIVVCYAAAEMMDLDLSRVLELSPIVGASRLALEGWHRGDAWLTFADMVLWPSVGAIQIAAAVIVVRRRRR